MDFTLSEEQQAIGDLADRILSEQLPAERIKEIEAADPWFAADVWNELAKADLLGIALPEADGGGGYSFFELALILEAVGRSVAPLPVLSTLVLGALPIAEFGTDAQRAANLPAVIAGERHLTAALTEAGVALPPAVPSTTAVASDAGWTLNGTKTLVPGGELADAVLVLANGEDGVTVFLVDTSAVGVSRESNVSMNLEPLTTFTFTDVTVGPEAVVGTVGEGAAIVDWITDRAIAATCSLQTGVCAAATRITGDYSSQRRQFETPIATFQAVAHRVADAYIDTEAVRLTSRQAAWRLADGRDAAEALAIAKRWAARGAHRVVHAAQHVHGGIGVDTDYPVHRTYRWAKHLEFSFGSGTEHTRRLGVLIADS